MGVLMILENSELNCSIQISHFGEPNCIFPEDVLDNNENPASSKNDLIGASVAAAVAAIIGAVGSVVAAVVGALIGCKCESKNGQSNFWEDNENRVKIPAADAETKETEMKEMNTKELPND